MVKSPFKASHLEYLSKSDWPEAVADDKEQPEPIENDEVAEAAEALEVVTSKKKELLVNYAHIDVILITLLSLWKSKFPINFPFNFPFSHTKTLYHCVPHSKSDNFRPNFQSQIRALKKKKTF